MTPPALSDSFFSFLWTALGDDASAEVASRSDAERHLAWLIIHKDSSQEFVQRVASSQRQPAIPASYARRVFVRILTDGVLQRAVDCGLEALSDKELAKLCVSLPDQEEVRQILDEQGPDGTWAHWYQEVGEYVLSRRGDCWRPLPHEATPDEGDETTPQKAGTGRDTPFAAPPDAELDNHARSSPPDSRNLRSSHTWTFSAGEERRIAMPRERSDESRWDADTVRLYVERPGWQRVWLFGSAVDGTARQAHFGGVTLSLTPGLDEFGMQEVVLSGRLDAIEDFIASKRVPPTLKHPEESSENTQ